ncbi:hypothetical protein, partial [Streptomyces sp. NPDC005538]
MQRPAATAAWTTFVDTSACATSREDGYGNRYSLVLELRRIMLPHESNTNATGTEMDHLWSEGLLGIVTGILTTVILFTIKALWTGKVFPLIEAIRYRGLKIDGVWEGEHV